MTITEKNIEKAIAYFEGLNDDKQEKLANRLLDEQAYLSTFVQQNIDNLFQEGKQIVDYTYNMYYTILYIIQSKKKAQYTIIDKEKLTEILEKEEYNHSQEELGDFIFTQYVAQDFEKEEFLKAIGLLNVVIKCLE
jgi:hypothetical protein